MEVIFLVNMNTHEIEEMLNDYFAKNKDDFFVNNYGWLYKIACEYLKIMPNKCSQDYMDYLDSIMPSYSDFEIFEFVKEYFKKYDIKLNLDHMLSNKTIVLKTNNENTDNLTNNRSRLNLQGSCNYRLVSVNSNVSYTDAIVLVHELSHFRTRLNANGKINYNTQKWYSETMAIAEEFIMLDSSLNVEKQYISLYRLNLINAHFKRIIIYLKIALVCKKYGNITKENYLKVWDEDNYEFDMINFALLYNNIVKDNNSDLFFNKIERYIKYSLAFINALHIMYKVRQNSEYTEKIKKMQKLVSTCSVQNFFDYFGLLECLNNEKEYCDPVKKIIEEIVIYSKVRNKNRM